MWIRLDAIMTMAKFSFWLAALFIMEKQKVDRGVETLAK